jgi:Cu/Ag efflux pump CusA
MAPLIFMPGLGAEIYRGLAAVVAGGMVVGTAFTWVLMPSLLRLGEEREAAPINVASPMPQAESVT